MKLPRSYNVQYSNDGTLLVCLGRFVTIHDVRQRRRIKNAHPFPHPSKAAFSADDSLLAVKSTSGRIAVLNPRTGEVLLDHGNQSEGEGSNVAFSPSNQQLVDGSWGGVITVRSALSTEILNKSAFNHETVRGISVSENSKTYVTEHSRKWDAKTAREVPSYVLVWQWPFDLTKAQRIELPIRIESVAVSPHGQTICCVAGLYPAMHVLVIRISDGKVVARSAPFQAGGTGQWLGWSRDGKIVASVQEGRFAFYSADNLNLIGTYPAAYPACVAFRPGTDEVALATWEETRVERLDKILQSHAASNVGCDDRNQPFSHFRESPLELVNLAMQQQSSEP